MFDDANPLYLVSVDPLTKKYRGSVRLLPTTGPNMLRDVFPFLLREGEFVESPTIWEISRICAVPSECQPDRSTNWLSPTFAELIVGIVEVGLMAGLTQIIAVFDARIYRRLTSNPAVHGNGSRRQRLIAECPAVRPPVVSPKCPRAVFGRLGTNCGISVLCRQALC